MGGTYLTLLNTTANLGKAWPAPLALSLIDSFGYPSVNSAFLLLGLLYMSASRSYLRRTESLPKSAWLVRPDLQP